MARKINKKQQAWGQRNSIVGKPLDLYVANSGLIFNIPFGYPSSNGSDP